MNDELQERLELLQKFKGTDQLSDQDLPEVEKVLRGEDAITLPEVAQQEAPEAADVPSDLKVAAAAKDTDRVDMRTLIGTMSLPQKLKLAMFGNAVCRGLLIRDANKMIQLCVLKNPKLMINEIEEFAKNPNLSDVVLRMIANSQAWTKSYTIKLNLVSNPKTPIDISLKWVKFLNMDDLKKLSKSRNVSQVISVAAKKRVADEQKRH